MSGAVLIHVQHLLGIGHLARMLRVAEAVAREGLGVTVLSGGMASGLPVPPGIRFIQLPPLRARDARFELVDATGAPLGEEGRRERRDATLAAFAEIRPDALVIEGYPFARRKLRFELDPLIAAARAAPWRPRVVCSVRDIVAVKDHPERHRDIVRRIRDGFDRVLVHGDPAFVRFDESFPPAPEFADRLAYTGYVAPPPSEADARRTVRDEVIVSAGGGATGIGLLRTALEARRAGCLPHLSWRLLAGTNLPEDGFAALRLAAPAGVAVERFRRDFTDLLRRCVVSVSQAGYNTTLEVLTTGARAVLVPFAAEQEREQFLRVERLAALGAVEVVAETELSPEALAAAIGRAVARQPARPAIDTGGAARSARLIRDMIGAGLAASARYQPGL